MNYLHLNANGAASVGPTGASGIGPKLHGVTVNTKGALANTLTLADSKGTIAVIDTVNITSQTLLYDVDCFGPLTATLATGTAADVTISWQ